MKAGVTPPGESSGRSPPSPMPRDKWAFLLPTTGPAAYTCSPIFPLCEGLSPPIVAGFCCPLPPAVLGGHADGLTDRKTNVRQDNAAEGTRRRLRTRASLLPPARRNSTGSLPDRLKDEREKFTDYDELKAKAEKGSSPHERGAPC